MANTKTTDETAASTIDGTELLRIVQGGNNRKATALNLARMGGPWGPVLSAVPTLSSAGLATWLNQGGATANDRAIGVTISAPTNSGDSIRARYKAAPSTPYKIKALVGLSCAPGNFAYAGIGWTDLTKLEVLFLIYNSGWKLQASKFNTVTSLNADDYAANLIGGNPVWLRIRDDGTTVYMDWSISGDDNDFITVFSVAKASGFLGSSGYSNVLFFANRNGTSPAQPAIGTLFSWNES